MSKILKNTTAGSITIIDVGNVTIAASPGQYTIPPQDYLLFAASSNTVSFVGATDLVVNDGSSDLTISDGIDLIKGIFYRNLVYTPTLYNLALTLANTEYSYALPVSSRRFFLKARQGVSLKLSYIAGQSGTTYIDIPAGSFYSVGDIGSGAITLYLQSPTAGVTLDIESWA